jgi:hypothetical protein
MLKKSSVYNCVHLNDFVAPNSNEAATIDYDARCKMQDARCKMQDADSDMTVSKKFIKF